MSLSKLKPAPSSFGGKETFIGQTALLPSYILCKMQKQKNSQGSRMETMGAGGQDSTAASGPSAPVVYGHFKLIVVFFVIPTAVAVSQPPPPLPRLLPLLLSSLPSLSLSLSPLSLSSLLSFSLSPPPPLLSSPLSPPLSPLPPPPQWLSPSPPEHSWFHCCRGAHPSSVLGLPHRCRCHFCHRGRQGVALRREQVQECSGKEHRWSQAIEPVVSASCDKTNATLT